MKIITEYRSIAFAALERAINLIDEDEISNLTYAALELRMALECLIYQKASFYKDELSDEEFSKWQPQKLLGVLLEIDEHADQSVEMVIESSEGSEYFEPIKLGPERLLSMREIKKHYHALGSYLHAQRYPDKTDSKSRTKLKKRLSDLSKIIESAVNSPLQDVDIPRFSKMDCKFCGELIVRRLPLNDENVLAKCKSCSAKYLIHIEQNRIGWEVCRAQLSCANNDCQKDISIGIHEVKEKKRVICPDCDQISQIRYCVVPCSAEEES
ncbi:Uncharacterised protein [BD1-7 clade bacterium]|uniref:Uncharacterized protein n=1 Tax=BD1-7 clade bacterium TaxID=2029982 RepID=A0A5S9Q6W6_9GAMM|nr:Uncharacterised protein [BD1-7 clade bacterium]